MLAGVLFSQEGVTLLEQDKRLFEATLTLPGIAGIVLTVGMAIDANILIFERIREEKNKGMGIRQAVENGYGRAFWTIFDANLTTLITALILFWVAVGAITKMRF